MITVYTTRNCSYCRRIKAFLEAHQLDFTEVDLGDDLDGRIELTRRTGLMTFPQIFRDGEFLGDCMETQELLLGELAEEAEDVWVI